MTGPESEMTIDDLSPESFVAGWRQVVGEAPAAVLEDRRAMLLLLVESLPLPSDRDRAARPRRPALPPIA